LRWQAHDNNFKLSVNDAGKAAAVPAILSDEELFLLVRLGWARLVDSATRAPLDPETVLAKSIARFTDGPDSAWLNRIAFADLWAKGYRMTSGIKFGVNWLAYR
jgi:tRNA splicing endonuclease